MGNFWLWGYGFGTECHRHGVLSKHIPSEGTSLVRSNAHVCKVCLPGFFTGNVTVFPFLHSVLWNQVTKSSPHSRRGELRSSLFSPGPFISQAFPPTPISYKSLGEKATPSWAGWVILSIYLSVYHLYLLSIIYLSIICHLSICYLSSIIDLYHLFLIIDLYHLLVYHYYLSMKQE